MINHPRRHYHRFGKHNGRTKHPWYRIWWRYNRANMDSVIDFEAFCKWLSDRDYRPERGDMVLIGKNGQATVKRNTTGKQPNRKRKAGFDTRHLQNLWRRLEASTANPADPYYRVTGALGYYLAECWKGEEGYYNFIAWARQNGGEGFPEREFLFREGVKEIGPSTSYFEDVNIPTGETIMIGGDCVPTGVENSATP